MIVSGRVQGVNYRASAREKANTLGITGWVRNLADGNVEILAEGDKPSIGIFIDWCRSGSRWARVEDLIVIDETPIGGFTSFEIRRDH